MPMSRWTPEQVERLQLGAPTATLTPRGEAYVVRVDGFDEPSSATISTPRPDHWAYTLVNAGRTWKSAAVFSSEDEALKDLRQFLLGRGYCAIFEDNVPDEVKESISPYIEDAVEDGFRSIHVNRTETSDSGRFSVRAIKGAEKIADSFSAEDARQAAMKLFAGH